MSDDSKDESLGDEELEFTPIRGVPIGVAWAHPIDDLQKRIVKLAKHRQKKHEELETRVSANERRLVAIAGEEGDDGKVAMLEERMSAMSTTIAQIQESAKKTAESAAGWWKWALGLAIPIVVLVVGAWMTVDRRISIVEVHLDDNRDRIRDINDTLDRIDDRLDEIGGKIGARQAPSPASPGNP